MKELITPFFGKERYNIAPNFKIILHFTLLVKRLIYIIRVYFFYYKLLCFY